MGCGISRKAAEQPPTLGVASAVAPQEQDDTAARIATQPPAVDAIQQNMDPRPSQAVAVDWAEKAATGGADVAAGFAEKARAASHRVLAPTGPALGLVSPNPEDDHALVAYAVSLLEKLHAAIEAPVLPIKAHSERLNSGERGISLAMLRALHAFYDARGALDKVMGDVCKEEGFAASIVALTRSTGLSLAESLVHVAGGDERVGKLVGPATTFFSYSWTGTVLRDQLWAVETKLTELEAKDGARRFCWVDMYAASQNLLAGTFRDAAVTKERTRGYGRARRTPTTSLATPWRRWTSSCSTRARCWRSGRRRTRSCCPSVASRPRRGRAGPGRITRAWCLFELAEALARKCGCTWCSTRRTPRGFGTC